MAETAPAAAPNAKPKKMPVAPDAGNWPTAAKMAKLREDDGWPVGKAMDLLKPVASCKVPMLQTTEELTYLEEAKRQMMKKEEEDELKEEGNEGNEKEEEEEIVEDETEKDGAAAAADAMALEMEQELNKADEDAQYQAWLRGVEWGSGIELEEQPADAEMEEAKPDKSWQPGGHHKWGKGNHKWGKGKSHGKGKSYAKGQSPGNHKGKGKHHSGPSKPWWSKHKWQQRGQDNAKGQKGDGKGVYDQWGGEYCVGGYRSVTGEFFE